MAILGAIGAFLAGAGGSLVKEAMGMANAHLEHKRTIEVARMDHEHELKRIELQMTANMAAHEQKRDIAILEADKAALGNSYAHDKALEPGFGWVDAIRALVRPTLTAMLGVYLMVVYLTAEGDLEQAITLAIIDLAFIAVGWWFAARKPEGFSLKFGPDSVERSNIRGALSRPS